jgi:hypothetical protein
MPYSCGDRVKNITHSPIVLEKDQAFKRNLARWQTSQMAYWASVAKGIIPSEVVVGRK